MHRMLLVFTVFLVTLSGTAARADQAAFAAKVKADPALLGYWPFEGNYKDQSGKGNDAKAFGDATLIKPCPGVKGGQGIELDNKTAEGQFLAVKAPIGGVFDVPKLSVFVWAKVNSAPELGHWDNILDRSSLWYMDTQWQYQADGNLGLAYVARIYDPANPESGGSDQLQSTIAGRFVNGNEWHMYGFTYDGQVMLTYLDDKVAVRRAYAGGVGPTAATPTNAPEGQYDINWGAFTQQNTLASGYLLNGCVDDTAYFGRALGPDEVKGLYDAMMQ